MGTSGAEALRSSGAAAVRTVLFDLDGTLIDSRELILSSFRHTMRSHLGRVPPDSAWLETMGTPLLAQLRDFAGDGDDVQAMMETYLEHNARVHDRLVCSFEGARATVDRLRERGYRVGLVTSKLRDSARRGLAACDLPVDWFEAVVTASDPVPHKPDPAPVRLALERMEEAPDRAIFVGDTVWDLRAGRAAGVFTAAALWGSFDRGALEAEDPDFVFESPEELPALLDGGPGRS